MIPYRYALRRRMMNNSRAQIVERGICGDGVTWELYSNGKLMISGTGAMHDYSASSGSPWGSSVPPIKRVMIANGVNHIGNFAFYECRSLTSVNISGSVVTIGNSAFNACAKITRISIPGGVTSIGSYAFFLAGLEGVIIPKSVTQIGAGAFYGNNALRDVYYTGTEQEWQAIQIGISNAPLLNATIHYNYNPT